MGKIKNCEWCGKEFEDKHRDGKRFCGVSCAAKYRASNFVNGMKGRTGARNPNWKGGTVKVCKGCGIEFNDDTYQSKQYCTRSCASKYKVNGKQITRNKNFTCMSCKKGFISRRKEAKYCSLECYRNSSEFSEKQGKRNRGKSVPESVRQAVSVSNSKRNAEKEYTSGNSGHYESKKAGNVFYRSSYELVGYKMLDSDRLVASFRPEPMVIEYKNKDGNLRRYRPDILVNYIDGSMSLVEIKPQWQISDNKVKIKIAAGRKYASKKGWRFEVWTEKELGL